jgi:hypothetical protein
MTAISLLCLAMSLLAIPPAAVASTDRAGWHLDYHYAGHILDQVLAVDCTSPTFCIAVGSYVDAYYDNPLALRYDGTGWAPFANVPRFDDDFDLVSVACTGPKDCIALGPGVDYLHWNGSKWSLRIVLGSGSLRGSSCLRHGDCFVVGTRYPDGVTLVERRHDGTWSVMDSPNPSGTPKAELDSVSCVSDTSCVAVGAGDDSGGHPVNGLIERWDGSAWTIDREGIGPPLRSVSCSSDAACMAVGGTSPYIVHWNGSAWSTLAPPPFRVSPTPEAVSCPGDHTCVVVASYGTRSPKALHWVDGTWVKRRPPGHHYTHLRGIDCLSARDCIAVGWWERSYPEVWIVHYRG